MADPIVVMTAAELRALLTEVIAEAGATSKPVEAARLLDRHALAHLLDVSLSTVDRLIREGAPRVYVGDAPRFDRERVMAWLEAREGERRSPATQAGTADADRAGNMPDQRKSDASSCIAVSASTRKSAKRHERTNGVDRSRGREHG